MPARKPSAHAQMPSTTLPPQTQRFQEKREAILSAAATLFNQHGVKGATLADIAASVGLVTNSVTYYYRKKEDLATACFLRAIEVFRQIADTAGAEPTVEARVQSFFRQHLALLAATDRGEHPPVMGFGDMRSLPSPHFEVVSNAYTDMARRVRDLLRAPQTTALSKQDVAARAYILLSTAHWMRGWVDRYEPVEYERIADRVSDLLLHGAAGPGACWSVSSDAEQSWRLGQEGDATQEAFLRAASSLVNEHGYRGASVDMISAQLNVTKGSFYHHNDNKEDLVLACFERSFSVIRRALTLAEHTQASGWDRASAVARSLARYQLSSEGPLLRLSATSALADPARRSDTRRTMARLIERLASVVVDGMVDGSIRPMHPVITAQVASGVINSAPGVQHWVQGVTPDNVGELYVRPVFIGLLCPPSAV